MSITHETWLRCKMDYIAGRGSFRLLAGRYGIGTSSVEKRARNEGWTRLRGEYETAQLAKMIPAPPPTLPPVPMAPDGTVSDEWLAKRVEIHYRRNTELLDKARTLLDAKLTASEKPTTDELGKMTTALSGIVSAEIALLGFTRRTGKQRRQHYCPPEVKFVDCVEPTSTPPQTNEPPN
jgi:hypothetical protein